MNNVTRQQCADQVCRPGKFQGEAIYVPYYWDLWLQGCADEDDGTIIKFTVTDADRLVFPELGLINEVKLRETDDGFVQQVNF